MNKYELTEQSGGFPNDGGLFDQEVGYVYWFKVVRSHKNMRKLREFEEYKRELQQAGIAW